MNNSHNVVDNLADKAKDFVKDAMDLTQAVSDAWNSNTKGNHGLHPNDFAAAKNTLDKYFPSLTLTGFDTPSKNLQSPDQTSAIAAADKEAGRVMASAVVSEGDVGELHQVYGGISVLTGEGQFAQARVGAAIDAAMGKLAAARATREFSPSDSDAFAQQFGSREAYANYKKEQLKKVG